MVQRLEDYRHQQVSVEQFSWVQVCRKDGSSIVFMSSLFRIHANLRSTVYCQAIAAGGATEWDFAWSEFLKATMATEAEKLRAALACTKQPWLLNRCDPSAALLTDCNLST